MGEDIDDNAEGGAFGTPTQTGSQCRGEGMSQGPGSRFAYSSADIERLSKLGQDADYDEIAKNLGEEAAKKGFQATGAYYPPNMEGNVAGTVAFSRKEFGSAVIGEELLSNFDTGEHVARMLHGHLHRFLERSLRRVPNIKFDDLPEDHFQKMVSLCMRLDTWGRIH